MASIHILSEQLTNMIAAGEVVDRPANVVKECIENSIDAGARSIDITIQEGGIERIRIQDDGCGMDAEDARMAFMRHATSKLQNEDDLFAIATMGFRGEALASIASVADVTMETSNGTEGTIIRHAYGKLEREERADLPRGTTIDVSGLFVKTPARFKYLRKPAYEFSVIADTVNKIALCHPDIRFTLTHNGRRILVTGGSGSLQEIVYQMYGKEIGVHAVPFSARTEDFSISGLAVQPKINRASKYFLYLSVNRRIIRSKPIQDAILEAYGSFLPPGRFPVCVLDITCDTQMVDVNVHPNKWEVRLSKMSELQDLIRSTIRNLFDAEIRTVRIEPERLQINAFEQQALQLEKEERQETETKEKQEAASASVLKEPESFLQTDWTAKENPEPYFPVQEAAPAGKAFLQDLRIIGQLKDSYILCECTEGLAIIDQHAAQERYHYEQLQKKMLAPEKSLQPLMVPLLVQVPVSLQGRLDALNEQLHPFGLKFESFGNGQAIIRQVPHWMDQTDHLAFLQDLLDHYNEKEMVEMDQLRKHVIATMACHTSIRFHRPLSMPEMQKVIEDLRKCSQPWHCPHGRPTVITLSDKDLRKEFERG